MGQIVFGVHDNKIGVRNGMVTGLCVGQRDARSLLDHRESSLGSREADKVFTEIVEPPAQLHRSVVCGVGSYKNEFDLIGHTGGQSLQSRPNICHVHGALIGAIGIAEKEERDRSLGPVPEIKRSTGRVSENKSRFRQGRRDQAAPVCFFTMLRIGRVAFHFLPRRGRGIGTQGKGEDTRTEKAQIHLTAPMGER